MLSPRPPAPGPQMGRFIYTHNEFGLTNLRGIAHSTSAGNGTSIWAEGMDTMRRKRLNARGRKVLAAARKRKFQRRGSPMDVVHANQRNAPKRQRLVATHDDRSRLMLSRGLFSQQRTADQQIIIRHKKGISFDRPVVDRRPRIHKLVEPAQIVQGRSNVDATTFEADSGQQAAFLIDQYTVAQLQGYLAASVNMSNSLVADGARGMAPAIPTTPMTQSSGTALNLNDQMFGVKFPVWKTRYTFKNTSNMRAHIELYDYVCKTNTNVTALLAWQDIFTQTNEISSTAQRTELNTAVAEITNTGIPGVTTIGYRPMGKSLGQKWTLVSSFKYDVEPGRTVSYDMKAFRKSWSSWDGDNANTTYQKGWSRNIIVIVRGSLISSSNVVAADDIISYSDARFTRDKQWKMMFYGYRSGAPQRSTGFSLEGTVAAGNVFQNVADVDQVQINPETDAGTAGFVARTA